MVLLQTSYIFLLVFGYGFSFISQSSDPYFLEFFYYHCVKVFLFENSKICHRFPMEIDIFLNFGMLSSLGLCPRHIDCYVVSLWVLFESQGEC